MCLAYTLFIVWAVLWKCGTPFLGGGKRVINLQPFHYNQQWELMFNIAIFVPFGYDLAATVRKPSWFSAWLKPVLATLLMSVALEATQYALAIGRSDVTDLLMNTLGGAIGVTVCLILSRLFRKHARGVTLAACILITLFEAYMVVSFLFDGSLNLGFMIIRI